MMASAGWTRAWTMRVSRVALGLGAGHGPRRVRRGRRGRRSPLDVPARSGFDLGQGAHAGGAPGELPRSPAADGAEAYRFARSSPAARRAATTAHGLEVALGGRGARRHPDRRRRLSRGAAVDGARAGVEGRAGGEAGRRGRGGREPRELPARGRERGGVRQRAARGGARVRPRRRRRPETSGEALAVEVSVEGDLAPVLVEGGAGVALRDAHGATVARYTDLAAFDADGVERRSWLEVSGGVVRLRVDDDGARYPLRIDPLVWTQRPSSRANNTTGWTTPLATSVSVSGDVAIVGAAFHQVGGDFKQGAAYVFVQSGTTWTQQAELTASDRTAGDRLAVRCR